MNTPQHNAATVSHLTDKVLAHPNVDCISWDDKAKKMFVEFLLFAEYKGQQLDGLRCDFSKGKAVALNNALSVLNQIA